MAISYVAVASSGGNNNGTTTGAGTASVTAGLPTGSASGDRVFVFQSASNTSATSPSDWTPVYKDVVVGASAGAPSAGAGQRYISCHYRDYDGVWSMPSWALTSATQNSHSVAAITLRKDGGDSWGTPTASGIGEDFGTANTAFSCTTPSFTTTTGAMVMVHSAQNDAVAASTSGTLTGTGGFVSGTVSERVDGNTSTGNDVSIKLNTCQPTTGATGTLTFAATISSSEGGINIVQQALATAPVDNGSGFFSFF